MSNAVLLKIKKSPSLAEGHTFTLQNNTATVGRSEQDCTLVIPDQGVSRKHCLIQIDPGKTVTIEDLASGNGTFVNGAKIQTRTTLRNRDVIRLHETLLEVFIPFQSGSAVKSGTASSSKSTDVKTPSASKAEKKGLSRVYYVIIPVACLLIMALMYLLFLHPSSGKKSKAGSLELTQTYSLADMGCKFNHPEGWERKDKYQKPVFGYSYFERSVLFFGTSVEGRDIMFCVDILNGVPPTLPLDFLVQSDALKFPRVLPHPGNEGKHFERIEKTTLAGKNAYIGISPSFECQGKSMKTLEAYIQDGARRFLLVGFTESALFPVYAPVFQKIIQSFQIEPQMPPIPRSENPSSDVNLLTQSADALVEKSHLKADNLYLALKDYRKAVLTENLYCFNADDPARLGRIEKFQKAQKLFDDRYEELKFEIERGLKVREEETIFNAASQIIKMIPDPEDKRYQYADRYYSRLREKYENKMSSFKYGQY